MDVRQNPFVEPSNQMVQTYIIYCSWLMDSSTWLPASLPQRISESSTGYIIDRSKSYVPHSKLDGVHLANHFAHGVVQPRAEWLDLCVRFAA